MFETDGSTLDIVCADDSRQRKPSRSGMGPLVAIGGIHVPGGQVRGLERGIDGLCAEYGFPPGEEFKWSPGRELWMRENLVGERRWGFFVVVLALAHSKDVKALVVIEDAATATATGASTAEEDVTRLFIERAHNQLAPTSCDCIVLVDRPGGDRPAEDKFLAGCLDTLQSGTDYVKPERIAFLVSTPSKFVRLLQVADVITGSTLAFVSGEERFAPPVFQVVKALLRSDSGRIGGVGLKIHPDYKYANLYHWLLDDTWFVKAGVGVPLPLPDRPYAKSSTVL